MGRVGAVGENAEEEEAKGADTNHRHRDASPQALPPRHDSGTVREWPFSLKGQEDTGQGEIVWFAHFLEPRSRPLLTSQDQESGLWLVDTGGVRRAVRFKRCH